MHTCICPHTYTKLNSRIDTAMVASASEFPKLTHKFSGAMRKPVTGEGHPCAFKKSASDCLNASVPSILAYW
jgi:hypothetical protein